MGRMMIRINLIIIKGPKDFRGSKIFSYWTGIPILRQIPKSICITPDSRYAFTANYKDHTVSIVDLRQKKTVAAISDVGESPSGIALSPDGKILYVTSWYSNDLWAFDLEFPSEKEG